MTELYEAELDEAPNRTPGDWWALVVSIAAGASLIAAFVFPPAGVVLFMLTTALALRRFRQMPVTVIVVAVAAVLAALATPPSFLSGAGPRSGPATGTSQHGAELVPSPSRSR